MAMATIKSYTDIERSKVLAEILPLDSADYFYKYCIGHYNSIYYRLETYPYNKGANKNHDIPCWSLSALLSVLPDEITDDGDVYRNMFFHLKGKYIIQYPRLTTLWPALLSVETDNPIDTCADMIVKLKEQNLI